jgi:hypothetical protein
MSRKIAPTLAERVRTPEFKASVERHRAKLDAEEAGWVVLDPKMHRALLAVARAARAVETAGNGIDGDVWRATWERLARALSRLTPPRRTGGGR